MKRLTDKWVPITAADPLSDDINVEAPMDFEGNGMAVGYHEETGKPVCLVWCEVNFAGYITTMKRALPKPPTASQRRKAAT